MNDPKGKYWVKKKTEVEGKSNRNGRNRVRRNKKKRKANWKINYWKSKVDYNEWTEPCKWWSRRKAHVAVYWLFFVFLWESQSSWYYKQLGKEKANSFLCSNWFQSLITWVFKCTPTHTAHLWTHLLAFFYSLTWGYKWQLCKVKKIWYKNVQWILELVFLRFLHSTLRHVNLFKDKLI